MTTNNIDYFESDQIKFALVLWKVAKKARQTDFDVLKFSHQWSYADTVLEQMMLSDDASTSQHAVELMQLRILFTQKFPERAKKMGAGSQKSSTALGTAKPHATTSDRTPSNGKPASTLPDASDKRYIKGVR